ncbi:MAG: DUF2141 domain-containing protein [bacterium]|jgi:uncharacterized protein (DUF2141 family)
MQKLILLVLCLGIGYDLSAQELKMRITGIQQGKGDILIAVFSGEDGFPSDTKKAVELLRATPVDGKAELTVKTLPPGRYAVSLFQDTNGDGKLNTNFLGIPKEGYGVSNNAFNTFSAPAYKDASFQYPKINLLNMVLKY